MSFIGNIRLPFVNFSIHNGDAEGVGRLKILLTYIFACCGVVFLVINSFVSFYFGSQLCSLVDIVSALVLSALIIGARHCTYLFFVRACIVIAFFLFLFLFIHGGSYQKGFIWSYIFPLITFFLLGCRSGLYFSGAFFFCCLLFMYCDMVYHLTGLYDIGFSFHFVFSYLLVSIFSYSYEYFRDHSEKAYIQLADNLEFLIQSRTQDIEKEIGKKEQLNLQLLQAKTEWERTFDAVPAHISIIDNDFTILRANKAMTKRLKLPYNQIIGKKCYSIVDKSESPPCFCPQKEMLLNNKSYSSEIYCELYGGYFFITVSPLQDENGSIKGAVHVAFDITERKRAEKEKTAALEKLAQAERLEAIGRIAGGVVHDLNNILSGVVTLPEMLLLTTPKENPLHEPLEAIQQSGKRAAAVVSDLLMIVRGTTTSKKVVFLNEVLQQYFSSLEYKNLQLQHSNVTILVDMDRVPMKVVCNPIHIQKVIMNLVTNAVEAVGKNGRVNITVRKIQDSAANPSCENNGKAVITVEDNGSGIGAEDLDHIFEPFFTKKTGDRSGTGLGLAIVKNIIEDHNGAIEVSSTTRGTLFTVNIPLHNKDIISLEKNKHISELKGTGKIMVVDDDESQREYVNRILEYLGYSVVLVSDGDEAIEYLKSGSAEVCLLDLHMAPGLNGIETYRKIAAIRPGQKGILVSGYLTQDFIKQAETAGINSIVNKPYTVHDLAQAIKNVILSEKT